MRALKKLLIMFIVLMFFVGVFVIDSVTESKEINKLVEEFKERGELVYETNTQHFYKVIKKYDYEDTSVPILRSYNSQKIGTTGDIYISNRDPMDFFLLEYISKRIYIGHSGLVYDKDANTTIEVVGNLSKEDNVVKVWKNNWVNETSPNYIFLRVKGMNEEKRAQFISEADSLKGQPFNYNFICKNKNKHYCSELVSYIYSKLGYNLNKDYYATTGADYIVDDDTYIIYYQETYMEGTTKHKNIYYLEGE